MGKGHSSRPSSSELADFQELPVKGQPEEKHNYPCGSPWVDKPHLDGGAGARIGWLEEEEEEERGMLILDGFGDSGLGGRH